MNQFEQFPSVIFIPSVLFTDFLSKNMEKNAAYLSVTDFNMNLFALYYNPQTAGQNRIILLLFFTVNVLLCDYLFILLSLYLYLSF